MYKIEERPVPFFNYPHVFKSHEDAFTSIFQDVCRRGAFIDQKDLKTSRRILQTTWEPGMPLGVSDGTDALIVAAICAGLQSGDEVIFCTHTMVATAASIHFTGATPIPLSVV